MQKFISYSLIILLFCTFSCFGGEVDQKLHQSCLYPTIFVGSQSGYGTGVIVRSEKVDNYYKNVFITCGHIMTDGSPDYEVKQYVYENWSQVKEIKSYPATFVAVDHEQDIAIGVFLSEQLMPTAIMDFEPKLFIGNEVFRIGCGLGDDPRLDYGKITGLAPKSYFRTSVMTVPGDSGSPLFHEYKVIGITVSILSYRNHPVFTISYVVPLDKFRQWDKANNNDLSFVWDMNKKLPELQFRYLKFREMK